MGVVHESHDQPENFVLIFQHQQIERALVATLYALDQLLILFWASMNTPHKTGRKIALLTDQACKHRLGLFAKFSPPGKFPARSDLARTKTQLGPGRLRQ